MEEEMFQRFIFQTPKLVVSLLLLWFASFQLALAEEATLSEGTWQKFKANRSEEHTSELQS